MALTREGYMPRLIDEKIARYLKIFGAVSIEGPKWCGKTWTSLNKKRGKFILTGSTSLKKDKKEKAIFHSGTGRIAPLRMHPMSLYESGDSSGEASLADMLDGQIKDGFVRKVELEELSGLIIRGGWPENLDVPPEDFGVIPKSYIESIVTKDMHEDEDRKRSPNKMRMLIRSLSRNESSLAGDKTLVNDIEE